MGCGASGNTLIVDAAASGKMVMESSDLYGTAEPLRMMFAKSNIKYREKILTRE